MAHAEWYQLMLKTVIAMSISTIWDALTYFDPSAMILWEKMTDYITVPNNFEVDSNLGVTLTSKTGNSNQSCTVPVAK